MRLAFLIPVIVFISPASAEWQIRTHIDPMTDRAATVATLPRSPGKAHCGWRPQWPQDSEDQLPTRFVLRIKTEHRFDDDLARRTASVSREDVNCAMERDPAAAAKRLAKAKRLRVQIFPAGAPAAFVDFDTTGADSAPAGSANSCGGLTWL
jgi:hypothetical protein